jgi:hypothetical protein
MAGPCCRAAQITRDAKHSAAFRGSHGAPRAAGGLHCPIWVNWLNGRRTSRNTTENEAILGGRPCAAQH